MNKMPIHSYKMTQTYKVKTMSWTETPWEIGLFNKTSMIRDLIVDPKHLKELLEKYDE